MWEFSVALDVSNKNAAKYIYKNLKKASASIGSVVTSYEESGNIYIVLGCEDYDKGRMQFLLSHLLSNVICRYFKERYLEENLSLPLKNDINLTAFKNALLSFDKETDNFIVSKNLSYDKVIYLESFYEFKLSALRDKWSELVSLANDNKTYLLSSDTFLELLKFLIDNLEIREGEINVVEDDGGYRILNDIFEELEDDDYYVSSLDNNEKLVASLIELCPRKINLYCENENLAIDLISKIFEKRVNLCERAAKPN